MKMSFNKNAGAAPVIDVPATTAPADTSAAAVDENAAARKLAEMAAPAAEIPTAPVGAPGTAIAVATPQLPAAPTDLPAEFRDDEIELQDIYLPRINLVHNVGDLSEKFTPGEIVLNQDLVIHTPANPTKKVEGNPPLIITVLGFKKKQFAEKVIGGAQGLFVNTEAEVVANNGTLSYKEWEQSVKAAKAGNPQAEKRYFQPYSTALLLIEKPAHITDDASFTYECDGKFYALALWGMKGTAFTHAAKHFFTQRKLGVLRTGYPARAWSLTTKLEKFGSNWTQIPVVKSLHANSPQFLEFVNTILGCSK